MIDLPNDNLMLETYLKTHDHINIESLMNHKPSICGCAQSDVSGLNHNEN